MKNAQCLENWQFNRPLSSEIEFLAKSSKDQSVIAEATERISIDLAERVNDIITC